MSKNKKGISLIVLVVTIVVIIILVATVLYNITDGKLFGVANESVFKNDLRVIEEEFEMFVQTKATQSVGKFEIESLNAADNGLTYNTKTKEKDIYDVIPTAKKGYYSEKEILTLIAHGILHLLGFDHLTNEDYNFVVGIQEKVIAELL